MDFNNTNTGEVRTGFLLITWLMKHMDSPGKKIHDDGWLVAKQREFENPEKAFQGLPPKKGKWAGKRVRVSQLSFRERKKLGINKDYPSPNDDVFHPLFAKYEVLCKTKDGIRFAGKNAVPMWAILNMLTLRLGTSFNINMLESVLKGLKDPDSPEDYDRLNLLNIVQHISWGAGEITHGVRPPDSADPSTVTEETTDLQPYELLEGRIAELDSYTTLPAVEWILNFIQTTFRNKSV